MLEGLYHPYSGTAAFRDADIEVSEDELVVTYTAEDGFDYRVAYDVLGQSKVSER